jgi:alpha-tubulin suppressor-like RCC1 family protein
VSGEANAAAANAVVTRSAARRTGLLHAVVTPPPLPEGFTFLANPAAASAAAAETVERLPDAYAALSTLSVGEEHTAVVRSDGALFTCGSNTFGQLGQDEGEHTDVLTRVEGALSFVGVSAENNHTAAITHAGELFTWGCGRDGRLGHGDEQHRLGPTPVQFFLRGKRVVAVAAGSYHTAAVTQGGEHYFWGDAVACGVDEDVSTPIRVGGALLGERVVAVTAGHAHTAVLPAAGAVYTFGGGDDGQLGQSDYDDRAVPTLVGGALQGRVAAAVSAGATRTVVVMQSGELYSKSRVLVRVIHRHDRGSNVYHIFKIVLEKHSYANPFLYVHSNMNAAEQKMLAKFRKKCANNYRVVTLSLISNSFRYVQF